MELRHLRYFVAVAEDLHFRRAAERLHIAQPSVSGQIRKLEQELGVQLFERDHRRVVLTPAGHAMLEEARRTLRQAEVAYRAAREADAGRAAALRLRVGYLPDALPIAVPHALRRLAGTPSSVDAELEAGRAADLLDAVGSGWLDAAVVCLPVATGGLRATRLATLGAVAALPAGDPRATLETIDLARIAPQRLCVLPRAANPAFYDGVVATCRVAQQAPRIVEFPDGDVAHALTAVAAGAGMALLPDAVEGRYSAPGVRLRPVVDPGLSTEVAVVTRRDPGPAAAMLVRALQQSLCAVASPEQAPALPLAA